MTQSSVFNAVFLLCTVIHVCVSVSSHNFSLPWVNKFHSSLCFLFQVMTSAQRDSFVEKTLSVKTGILKQSVNAEVAMLLSTGILLTAKVGLFFLLSSGWAGADVADLWYILSQDVKKKLYGSLRWEAFNSLFTFRRYFIRTGIFVRTTWWWLAVKITRKIWRKNNCERGCEHKKWRVKRKGCEAWLEVLFVMKM